MYIVPTTIPPVLTPEVRKRVVVGAVQDVESTLCRKLGDTDPHGLRPAVLGECLARSAQAGSAFNPVHLEEVANAYMVSVLSELVGELSFIHQVLTAGAICDGFSGLQACTADNDYGYKVFAVLNGGRGFFVCLSESANDAADSVTEVHLRSLHSDEVSSTSALEALLSSGMEVAIRIGSRSPVDRGYLLSLIPTEASPPKWIAGGALADWSGLSAAVADLVALGAELRASVC